MLATLPVGSGSAMREIAVLHRPPAEKDATQLVWLGGYRSDMTGTKAVEVDRLAAQRGLACLRFDYSGHGQSGGEFTQGTISRWVEETLAVLAAYPARRLVLIGSSMGGWIALRALQALKTRADGPTIGGLVLIAPAPDFTSDLIEPALTDEERRSLEERGFFEEASEYSPQPNIFTRALIEDGRDNRVLVGTLDLGCPVHILQGMQDEDVPYRHALKLLDFLPADDVVMTLVRDGDHRLSRPKDIERMLSAIETML
ncbi:alpha/beta hydrolase [Rhizobium sp. SSA_523]|uniref:alpha/beta hydrolase n=1 Tax=Rhizobium sp. SSA_523 TaxID=2952477 RepID=UPI0020900904|nr:alpha/beta hydrolase [Rhizobium sp. SSA_523]MCO5732760.1 alpha/beta hydrolase [Rhizobium sp. SSA_523]WKC25788.1 alpha/beta hydrolase [Rhizobium sp. SSA_523]